MQKLIGCILILLSTTAGGFLYGVEQQQYLEKLMYIPPYSGTDPGRNRIQRRTSF